MNKKTIVLTLGLVLLAGIVLTLPKSVSAADTKQWMQEKVTWQVKPDACWYNIYYKEKGFLSWQHAVRKIPAAQKTGVTWRDYTISYLPKGKQYDVNVKAYVCSQKQEKPVVSMTSSSMMK